jgi:hypothetical protein
MSKIRTVLLFVVYILVGVVSVGGIVLAGFVWFRSWGPFMDDGPFHGTPRVDCPASSPDQTFPIYNGNTLLVYDPKTEEASPTVALKDRLGILRWCIYADAFEKTKVHKLRFYDYQNLPFRHPRVRGLVEWTFGHESMWWFIERNGSLEEYWYSW